MTYDKIRERYLKNYITDAQLRRFAALGIITDSQRSELTAEKYPAADVAETAGEEVSV